MKRIAPRQLATLRVVHEWILTHGSVPSTTEIARRLGISNPGAVGDHLKALAKKGYIERADGEHRALRVTEKGVEEATRPTPAMVKEAMRRYARAHDLLARVWVVLPHLVPKDSPLMGDLRDELARFEKPLSSVEAAAREGST